MSENEINKPSLLELESTGGDIAEGGFEFQRNIILNKIPFWLSYQGFTSLIWESIGDIEAKFFMPEKGSVIEAVEAKNHLVTPTKFWNEIDRFKRMDKGSPGTYRWFTICCTDVSAKIKPLINGLKRIRDPYAFYEETLGIIQNSYEKYKNIVLGLGEDEETADFLYNKVLIENTWGSLNAQSEGMFKDSLLKNFSEFEDLSMKKTTNVYSKLIDLLVSRRNKPVTRKEIEDTIANAIDDSSFFFKANTNRNQNCKWKDRIFPASVIWENKLIKELKETKDWIARNRNNRIIRLTGSRRNSTAMAIGHTFSAVSGFNIEMEHRGDFWKTIHYPTSSTPDYPISINYKAGRTKKLVVVVSIMKVNVPKDVLTFLESTEDIDNSILEVTSELPIVSSDQANIAVHKIKEEIKKICSKINVSEIYFFYAGPSHLSLYLGYRWNAIPKTRCYEWVGPANYVQTVTLE